MRFRLGYMARTTGGQGPIRWKGGEDEGERHPKSLEFQGDANDSRAAFYA